MDSSLGIDIVDHRIDWGDGTPFQGGEILSHSYKQPGEYLIRYWVKTKSGEISKSEKKIRIAAPTAPVAKIDLQNRTYHVGEKVAVRDASGRQDIQRIWSSNGRTLGTDASMTWEVRNPGVVELSLQITDRFGQSSKDTVQIQVAKPSGPTAKFRFASAKVKPGESITMINESSDNVVRYGWTLPDGFSKQRGASVCESPTVRRSQLHFEGMG